MFGILRQVIMKMKKYLASITDNSAITCDEIIELLDEETKTILTNLNEKKRICKIFN